jgi:hypothetical protein
VRHDRAHVGSSRYLRGLARAAIVVLAAATTPAEAGHELPFYPSFYPQEIKIETVPPAAAAGRLQDSTLHAYIGADPFAGRPVAADVIASESFGSYIVVNVDATMVTDRAARCALADKVRARLARLKGDFVFHPYPVTPYHADYLGHFDRADAAAKAVARRADAGASSVDVSLQGRGHVAEALVAALGATASAGAPSATIEQVDLEQLVSRGRTETSGWLGPPWLKQGWYQTYLLESPVVSDPDTRRAAEMTYQRLVTGAYDSVAARLDLQRALVAALIAGCERVVAGYALKRDYTSAEYSQGVENVGSDSQFGLDSAIFVRTVKLKDFPWNGWLRVGTPSAPTAAWNPIAGFTDVAGRLMWAALGDPAFIPAPGGATWLPNRTNADVGTPVAGGVGVPADAVRPVPGSGLFTRIGPGKRARTKLVYRVRASAFHDGTRMTVADVLYWLGLAFRWGGGPPGRGHDPAIAAATARLRQQLVGLRLAKVETVVKKYSDIEFVYEVPIVEVYVDHGAADPAEVAAIAPPWSVVPWHLAALMEEAVARGIGAFSEEDAARRGVPWLDLVRDAKVRDALAGLLDTFGADGYVPPALRKEVTVGAARARWSALRRFYQDHGHLLVTNGPYRLDTWSADAVVLSVFRDLSYPLGVGNFDDYAVPLRAYVAEITDRGDRLEIRAEVEKVSKFARSYEIVREPLGPRQPGLHEHVPSCRYVVLTAGGGVVRAGRAPPDDRRVFRVDLHGLPPGTYTAMIAFEVQANVVNVPITVTEHRVGRR